jgi:putative endonuclease
MPRGYLYILLCADNSYYTVSRTLLMGVRTLIKRVKAATTRRDAVPYGSRTSRVPNVARGLSAERQVKGWTRAKKEALIRGDWEALKQLSRNRQGKPRGD